MVFVSPQSLEQIRPSIYFRGRGGKGRVSKGALNQYSSLPRGLHGTREAHTLHDKATRTGARAYFGVPVPLRGRVLERFCILEE